MREITEAVVQPSRIGGWVPFIWFDDGDFVTGRNWMDKKLAQQELDSLIKAQGKGPKNEPSKGDRRSTKD